MFKKLAIALTVLSGLAVYLLAADFWTTKPYTEWDDKEVQKIIEDSPWADKINVRTGQQGVIAQSNDGKGAITGELEVPVRLIWQSALPVKQALSRRMPEADGAALIAREEPFHVMWLQGLPGTAREAAQEEKDKILEDTMLKVKGKPDLHPADYQMAAAPAGGRGRGRGKASIPSQVQFIPAFYQRGGGRGGGFAPPAGGFGGGRGGFGTFDVYFLFPRTDGYTVEDKEVEFVTKIGKVNIKRKFKFKDMVYNGKLEM